MTYAEIRMEYKIFDSYKPFKFYIYIFSYGCQRFHSTESAQVNKSDFLSLKFLVNLIICIHVFYNLFINAEYPHLYSVLQKMLFVWNMCGIVLVVEAEAGSVAVVLKRNNENDCFHAFVDWQDLFEGNSEALGGTRDSLHANVCWLLFVSFGDLVG